MLGLCSINLVRTCLRNPKKWKGNFEKYPRKASERASEQSAGAFFFSFFFFSAEAENPENQRIRESEIQRDRDGFIGNSIFYKGKRKGARVRVRVSLCVIGTGMLVFFEGGGGGRVR